MPKKYLAPVIIFIVIAFDLFLGLSRIGRYSAVDEPYWTYDRTPQFWTAIEKHKWRSTNINDKPGVTTAALSGFGLLAYDPLQYKSLRGDPKTDQELHDINAINFFFRLPIFLFCIFSTILFYHFLKKLFGRITALLGFIFISLSPILFGISLIINPDSLLWLFLPLSLLAYAVFQKNGERRYLWATGFFFGLALLTKYVANILYVFFFLLPFLEYVLAEKKPELTPYLKNAFKNYLVIVAISMITYFALFPATWAHPSLLLKGTFLSKAFQSTWPLFVGTISVVAFDIFFFKNKITYSVLAFITRYKVALVRFVTVLFLALIAFTFVDTYLGMKPFDLISIISSPKGIGSVSFFGRVIGALSADMYGLIFGLPPLVFLVFLVALIRNMRRQAIHEQQGVLIFSFILFILFYYFASTVNGVIATVRYQIALYPLALIIAALGLTPLFTHKAFKKNIPRVLALFTILIITASSLWLVRPFYFAYASSLLPQQYLLNMKDMGDGSYEAAALLNARPDAHELSIWSDKGAVCAVFKGNCTIGFTKKDLAGKQFDYFVISSGRVNRSLKMSGGSGAFVNFGKVYSTETPAIETITLNSRPNNFVKIIATNAVK